MRYDGLLLFTYSELILPWQFRQFMQTQFFFCCTSPKTDAADVGVRTSTITAKTKRIATKLTLFCIFELILLTYHKKM